VEDSTGQVYVVGAGPEDPDLITVKALRLLREADVIVYDKLVSAPILALGPPGTTRIFAGKAARSHHMPQPEINSLLVSLARSGRTIIRLKGGDPFVFGRGGEEDASAPALLVIGRVVALAEVLCWYNPGCTKRGRDLQAG
jgi:uroporphyrin-III C-methyltransferase/precorrin-2 dehydrogenase/sirohydrochlorin ferrochelatase/uroporphyrin-III C-methyltransferase